MIVGEGPLVWPIEPAGLGDLDQISAAQVELAEQLAVDWLWDATARRFGTNVVRDRPQTAVTRCELRDYPSYLRSVYGYSRGWPYESDPRTAATVAQQVYQLQPDALSITAIVGWPAPGVTDPAWDPDTGAFDPAAYRLEGNYLVRQDGGTWPKTQNLIAALGQPDTWQVTYVRGIEVPLQGQRCAGQLALQFGQALIGKKDCKLPFNVTTVTRSGVTISRDVLKALKTSGISEVDQWVARVNPQGLQQAPRVWSPDLPRNAGPYLGSYAGGSATALP